MVAIELTETYDKVIQKELVIILTSSFKIIVRKDLHISF
jgi:hypothetical protein